MIPFLFLAATLYGEPATCPPGVQCSMPAAGTPTAPGPRVDMRMNRASATSAPWVVSNGWRYARGFTGVIEAAKGGAALAAVEAAMWNAAVAIKIDPADLAAYVEAAKFVTPAAGTPLANFVFADDGTAQSGELINLFYRRNLLFTLSGAAPVRVTPKDFDATNPSVFAAHVRAKIGDDARLLRVYGSEVVIGRLTREGGRTRLDLINYSGRGTESLRVRVLGKYKGVTLQILGGGGVAPLDVAIEASTIEFSVPSLPIYAVALLDVAK